MLAATPAARFIPTASLPGAPEDLLVYILSLLPVIDVLSVRRCCRRLYHITKARIVWLEALRRTYTRRHLPPLASPAITSKLPTVFLEHRATRPWRFLHALADIHSAKFRRTTHPIEDLIAHPPEEEGRGRSGVIGFNLLPGGRWLCLVYNRRAGQEPSKAVLVIWDTWRNRRLLSFPLHRSAHFAHFEYGEDGMSIEVVIGFDKTRQHDPFFNAMSISLAKPDGGLQITSMLNLKVERTPRACSVHDHVLSSVDRLGHVTFWAWKESLFATTIVAGFPATKGKLMLLSRQHFATFNPASSAFAVHLVPLLTPLAEDPQPPAPADVPRAGGMMRLLKQGEDAVQAAASQQPPPYYHLPPPTGISSMGIRRFRLPARSLNFTTPEKVAASSFYTSNAAFLDPFLGYVVLSHPDTPAQPYLGLIPAIDSGELDDPEDLDPHDEDDEDDEPEEDEPAESDGVDSAPGTQEPQGVVSPHLPPAPIPAILALPHVSPVIDPPAQLGPPPVQPPPDPEYKWLTTLRCVDSTTTDTFAPRGRILRVGPLDHYVSILRSTEDGKIEIFTTAALHSKPEIPQPAQGNRTAQAHLGRAARQQQEQQNQQRLPMPAFNFRALIPPPMGDMTAGLRNMLFPARPFSGPLQSSGAGPSQPRASSAPSSSAVDINDVVAQVNLEAVMAEIDRAGPSGSSQSRAPPSLLGFQPRPMASSLPSAPLSGPSSPSSTRSNPMESAQSTNPHSRMGAYAEGDFQYLDYQAPGEVWASTVDDVSGKICLVVENIEERPEIVVLDYGWDFWKIENNEEKQWDTRNEDATGGWVVRSQSV
ncbi:hypothetical protein FRC05_008867 [Tulasnella sp. 425]|nr:hypothetical protein FRC05_008867 [Tulasnella sp. 425]